MRGLQLAEVCKYHQSLDFREDLGRYLPLDQKRAALFIEEWEGFVLAILRRMRVEDEQDVLYRVFQRVFNALTQFRKDSKLSTWLYRISMREAVRSLGIQTKQDSRFCLQDDIDIFATVEENTESMLIRQETGERVKRSLARLAPIDREVLALRFAQDLKYKEIAERLDMPLGTVKVRVHRALKHLEKILENDHEQ